LAFKGLCDVVAVQVLGWVAAVVSACSECDQKAVLTQW
jgi:hypothetical protein